MRRTMDLVMKLYVDNVITQVDKLISIIILINDLESYLTQHCHTHRIVAFV